MDTVEEQLAECFCNAFSFANVWLHPWLVQCARLESASKNLVLLLKKDQLKVELTIVQLHVPHQRRLEAKHQRTKVTFERFFHLEGCFFADSVTISHVFSQEIHPAEALVAAFSAYNGAQVMLLVVVQSVSIRECRGAVGTLENDRFCWFRLDVLDVNPRGFAHFLSRQAFLFVVPLGLLAEESLRAVGARVLPHPSMGIQVVMEGLFLEIFGTDATLYQSIADIDGARFQLIFRLYVYLLMVC